MGLENKAEQTYSFDSATIEQIVKELVALLESRGVDIRDRQGLKAGYEGLFRIEYVNLPDLDAHRYILAPNHVSDFDALLMGLLHQDVTILSKQAWVDNAQLMGFLGPHYTLLGIDRDSKVSQARALVEIIKHLKAPGEARHALIFPQGTISDLNENSLERVQEGVFTLSGKAGVPVLPVFIEQPNFERPTRIAFGAAMGIPARGEDCRAAWRRAVLALQEGLSPPARRPVLTEKHKNNNKPGDPFF